MNSRPKSPVGVPPQPHQGFPKFGKVDKRRMVPLCPPRLQGPFGRFMGGRGPSPSAPSEVFIFFNPPPFFSFVPPLWGFWQPVSMPVFPLFFFSGAGTNGLRNGGPQRGALVRLDFGTGNRFTGALPRDVRGTGSLSELDCWEVSMGALGRKNTFSSSSPPPEGAPHVPPTFTPRTHLFGL